MRRRLTVWVAALLSVVFVYGLAYGAEDAKPTDQRPEWCKPGWSCLPTRVAADLAIKLTELETENDLLKLRRKKLFGWAAVCGPSASLQVHDGRTDLAGTISCTVGLGARW